MAIALIKEKKPKIEAKVEEISVKSYWLYLRDLRLDASYYAEEGQRAIRILKESEYEIRPLGSESISKRIFNPPPIKRQYSGLEGTPYLTPTELFQLRIKASKHVFANKMEDIEDWFVKDGWIIITQSGRVGVPFYVTEPLAKFVISQNAIRIVPEEDIYPGFLYAYLSTWLGQALITKDQFGVSVDHIRPSHVSNIPIPMIPEEIQRQIHFNIKKVFALRDKARSLLDNAEHRLFKELNLPPLKTLSRETIIFTTNTSRINFRFDASYHDPVIEDLVEKLKESGKPIVKIGEKGEAYIPPRFRRIYVDKEYGIPFLQGTDIHLIKPRLLKYISKKVTKNLEDWIISSHWILVTCSGTIGRVSLAPEEWDEWAVTQHVARIIPNPKEVHEGYLTAFLSSEYGYQQLVSKIYGGVVDELTEDDIEDVFIALPQYSVQKEIGELVVEAYELRELANKIEDNTIKVLEDFLFKRRKIEPLREIESYVETLELLDDEEFIKALSDVRKGDFVLFNNFEKEQ